MDNQSNNQQNNQPQQFLLHQAQFVDGLLTPRMLAATPTRANGDLYYSNGSTFQRLAPGTTGQLLTITNGIPAWQTPAPVTNPDPVIADAINARTTNNISLTAGTSKVVKESMVFQDDTTNSYQVGFMQSGWGWLTVTGGNSIATKSVSLPVVYTGIKSVVVSLIGITNGSVSSIGSATNAVSSNGQTMAFGADSITTSGFNVSIKLSSNAGINQQFGYSWITTGY